MVDEETLKSYQINAPWNDEQVAALNRYQQSGKGHPFTGERHPDGSECILIATNQGWTKCDGGPVIQTWAWDFMAAAPAERSLTTEELFGLTTKLIGHCDDKEQLKYIINYTKLRLKALTS